MRRFLTYEVFFRNSGWHLAITPSQGRVYFRLYWSDKVTPTHEVSYDTKSVLECFKELVDAMERDGDTSKDNRPIQDDGGHQG